LVTIVASALMGGVVAKLIEVLVNRGKPAADIHETRARASKELAEAHEIRIRADFSWEEETIQRTGQMIQAQRLIFDLQEKNRRLTEENNLLRSDARQQIGGKSG